MKDKFVVTPKYGPKEDKSVTMTIRIDKELQQKYDELAHKSNRSRNELMSLALEFAINNLVFKDEESE